MKVLTLTLNPAFDVHCEITDFKSNIENYASSYFKQPGGKGINISRALNSVGVKNTAFLALGKENGEEFLNNLKKDNINVEPFFVEGKIRENITVHSNNNNETRISLDTFFLLKPDFEKIAYKIFDECDSDTILTLTGKIPKGLEKKTVIDFLKQIKTKGTKIIVDSNSFDISDLLELRPWLIKPNEQESGIFDISKAVEKANEINSKGIENVVLSLGEKGAAYAFGNLENGFLKAPKIKSVSTIGAGDSMIAGLIFGFMNYEKTEDIVKMGIAFGSAACLTAGSNPPRRKNILEIFEEIK